MRSQRREQDRAANHAEAWRRNIPLTGYWPTVTAGLGFFPGKHEEEHPATDESKPHRHRDFLRFLHRHRQGFVPNADELLISVVGKFLITKGNRPKRN